MSHSTSSSIVRAARRHATLGAERGGICEGIRPTERFAESQHGGHRAATRSCRPRPRKATGRQALHVQTSCRPTARFEQIDDRADERSERNRDGAVTHGVLEDEAFTPGADRLVVRVIDDEEISSHHVAFDQELRHGRRWAGGRRKLDRELWELHERSNLNPTIDSDLASSNLNSRLCESHFFEGCDLAAGEFFKLLDSQFEGHGRLYFHRASPLSRHAVAFHLEIRHHFDFTESPAGGQKRAWTPPRLKEETFRARPHCGAHREPEPELAGFRP